MAGWGRQAKIHVTAAVLAAPGILDKAALM